MYPWSIHASQSVEPDLNPCLCMTAYFLGAPFSCLLEENRCFLSIPLLSQCFANPRKKEFDMWFWYQIQINNIFSNCHSVPTVLESELCNNWDNWSVNRHCIGAALMYCPTQKHFLHSKLSKPVSQLAGEDSINTKCIIDEYENGISELIGNVSSVVYSTFGTLQLLESTSCPSPALLLLIVLAPFILTNVLSVCSLLLWKINSIDSYWLLLER